MTDANQSNPPSSTPVPSVNISVASSDQLMSEKIIVFLNILPAQPTIRQYLDGVRYRVLSTQAIENLDYNENQTQPGRWSSLFNRTWIGG